MNHYTKGDEENIRRIIAQTRGSTFNGHTTDYAPIMLIASSSR